MTDLRTLKAQLISAKKREREAASLARKAELSFYYNQWDGRRAHALDVAREQLDEASWVVIDLEGQIASRIWEDLNPQLA